jgi:hypothetical protein
MLTSSSESFVNTCHFNNRTSWLPFKESIRRTQLGLDLSIDL